MFLSLDVASRSLSAMSLTNARFFKFTLMLQVSIYAFHEMMSVILQN